MASAGIWAAQRRAGGLCVASPLSSGLTTPHSCLSVGSLRVPHPLLPSQPRSDGEVMPTLDMALFDWTDYEDLKPEVWPSTKKKGTVASPTPRQAWALRHRHLLGDSEPRLTC